MTPNSVISLAPTTKEQIALFAGQLIDSVKDGFENPLTLHTKIIAFKKALDAVSEAIKDDVVKEAERHNQKSFDYNGCRIEIKDLGVKYDFASCCDPKWERAKSDEQLATTLRKEREVFLKGIKTSETIIDEDTGEVIKLMPPIKTSNTGITVTLK